MKWWNRWLTDDKHAKRSAPLIEELEPRVLLSADAAGVFAPDPGSLQQQTPTELILDDNLEPAPSQQVAQEEARSLELVFVDTDSPDYQSIVDSLTDANSDSRQFEVIVLDNNRDGVWQISQALQNFSDVDAIHLVSHGDSNGVDLGNTRLDANSLAVQRDQFLAWSGYLADDADILIYGCNLAGADSGLSLMRELALLTGADVAASEDLTGHTSLGGNWVLEARVGEVSTQVFASQGLLQNFRATLAAPVANDDTGESYEAKVGAVSDGYFQLDDATDLADENSAGNDGTATGGVSTSGSGATAGGGSLAFDNSDTGYVSIPHSSDYELTDGAISLWFNTTTIVTQDTLFSKDASGTTEGGHLSIYFVGDGANAEVQVRLQNNTAGGTNSHFVTSTLPSGYFNDGNWHNVVFTFGADGMALYIDGQLEDTDTYDGGMTGDTGTVGDGGDVANQEPIYIGASRRSSTTGLTPPSGNYFEGAIDELAIVNQQLTQAQVADLYRTAAMPYVIDEDSSLTTTAATGVLANDTDADGDPLTASLVTGPGNAESFSFNSDGSFTYTPAAHFSGTDSFVYQADDGNGGTDTATATITVNAVADDPAFFDYRHSVSLSAATPTANYPVQITLTEGVNGFAHANAQANGEDLRFFDSNGIQLDYYIEEWNNSGTTRVWVEVADAGETAVELYYGNSSAVAQSNGEATFDFFDDFNDQTIGSAPAGWTITGNAATGTPPAVEVLDDEIVFSDGSAAGDGDAVIHTGSWSDAIIRQDFRVETPGDGITDATVIFRYQDANHSWAAGIHSDSSVRFWYNDGGWAQVPGSEITGVDTTLGYALDDGNWHTQEIRVSGDTVEAYIDGIFIGSADYSGITGLSASGTAGFWSQNGGDQGYRDNHIVLAYDAGTGVITGTAGAVASTPTFTIDENTANTTPVGSVHPAADADGDSLSYSITAGNTGAWTGDAFAIDGNGLITVNNSDALNFEDTPTFNLTVEINDGTGRTDTQVVTVNLNDINDPATGAVFHALLDDDGDSITEDGERLWSIQSTPIEDEDDIVFPINITWYRDGVQIPGALGIFYTLTQDDVGADITSVWSFNDMGGNSEAVTSSVTSISNNNDAPTGSVTISGTPQSGETLNAANTLADVDGMTTSTITYHWQRDTGSGFVDTGDTGSTYTLTGLDVGANVRAEARYTDDEGTDEALASNSTGAVAPGFGADIISIETADLNDDGFIDTLHVTFDDFIQDSTVRADDFDVAGVGGEAFSSTTNGDVADDDDIYITFTDGVLRTDATPQITYLGDRPTDPDILDSADNVAGDFAAWWNTDWQSRMRIDINNAASATNVTDFPLLVELSGTDVAFADILAGGADIRFVDSDGTPLSYAIESWDDGGETARIWVRVPQLDAGANDESIYMYFNNGAAADGQNLAAVWSDGLGVYHFNEDPGPGTAGDILDSSPSGNNGTAEASMTSSDLVAGRIGTGTDFDEIDDNITFGGVDVGDSFTISAWVRPDSTGDSIQTIVANSGQGASTDGFRFFINTSGTEDGSILFETGNGTNGDSATSTMGVINFDEWNHVAVEVDRATGRATIYHNGVDVTDDSTVRTDFNTSSDFRVGQMESDSLEYKGVIDELRIESVGRSADFIHARYLSQLAGGTFTRLGATEAQTQDTAAPVATITRDDADNTNAASVTFSVDFSEDVTNVNADDFDVALTGTAAADTTVSVTDAGDTDDSTYAVTVSGISGEGTVGLDIDAGNVDIVDAVGNAMNNTPVTDQVYSVDQIEPMINSVALADASLTVGESSTVTITFSEAVTNFENGDITLANGTLTPVSSSDGGITWTGIFTPTDDIEDATNVITVGTTLTDLAGSAPLASRDSPNYVVDTREPLAPVISGISDDTGAAGDGITNDNTLEISGTAEANSSVEVFIDAVSLGTVSADGSGNWTFDHSGTALPDGAYTLTARATDTAGNPGPLSAGFVIDVDTGDPAAPTVLSITDDTGLADNITSDNQLVFAGTAEASSTVEVLLNAVSIGTVPADASGDWTLDHSGTTLTDGAYTLTSRTTDAAGNSGPLSAGFTFTVDTAGPAAAVTAISDDSGLVDNVTNDNQLVFTGTADADNVVEVFLKATSLGTVVADGSGNWTFDHSATTLTDGDYTLTAQARDTATDQSGAVSAGLAFTIDTSLPVAVVSGVNPDTGFLDTITSASNLNFEGTADAGATVEVFLDSVSLGTVVADGSGNWSFDYTGTTLADGGYSLEAQATDTRTGDTGPVSATLGFTVDTTPPPNTPPFGAVNIDNTDPSQGDVLTASNTLADSDGLGSITYHWQRDTGSGFVDIGTTGTRYTATQEDVGATLRVEVRYVDLRGFAEAVASGATAAVANFDDAGTGTVTIDNLSPVQGDTLTASNTLDDPDGLSGTVAYQWQRDGVDVAGQNGTIYITSQADVGAVISVVASYIDDLGGTGAVASAATAPVADINDTPSGSVTISGSAVEDAQLTASNTLGDNDGLGAISYQWQRDGVDVDGATGETYTLGQEDVGAVITVVASYTDGSANAESVISSASAPVANVNDAPTGTILSTSGATAPGDVLTASNGLFDEDGISDVISFQWMRNSTAIAGATDASYTLVAEDVGEVITVSASYTDDFGTNETVESQGIVARANGGPGDDDVGPEVRDEPGQVIIPNEQLADDVVTGPINTPAVDDPAVPPPSSTLDGPVLSSDIGSDPVLEVGDTLDIGNQTGTGNSLLNFGNQPGTGADAIDEGTETEAVLAQAERDRELVEDLLQMIQNRDAEEEINITAGAAGSVTLDEVLAEDEELAVVDDILTNHALWNAIDQMNEEMGTQSIHKLSREELVVQFVSTSGLGLFAAITVYALRGGALMASWLSTVPLWGTLDPLPVLADKRDEEKEEKGRGKHTRRERDAESLFSGQEGA